MIASFVIKIKKRLVCNATCILLDIYQVPSLSVLDEAVGNYSLLGIPIILVIIVCNLLIISQA